MNSTSREPQFSEFECRQAAALFRALGDEERLRLVLLLSRGECSVGEIAERLGDALPTVSQRLKTLRYAGLVRARRDGRHVYYGLDDAHVEDLVRNALEHASHANPHSSYPEHATMKTHDHHPHQHGPKCGHTAIKHEDHVGYLHDGHLHFQRDDGVVEEHALDVNATNPDDCTPGHQCGGHDSQHVHGPDCGHPAVPHGDHVDYLVDGHLHHPHGDHCDDHGPVDVVK
jgi:DNA-binding transcriptional ArsR family regulator